MQPSPSTGRICEPPVIHVNSSTSLVVDLACYEPRCKGPYCSVDWIGGSPDQHLGYCDMPSNPALYDNRCVWPYCDALGQCALMKLTGVKPQAPYWAGSTGERSFAYQWTRTVNGNTSSVFYQVGKCMYDDWNRSDNALRGSYAQPAPNHPRRLQNYSPNCLFARCEAGHCVYEPFNFGNPCSPSSDFCVDRKLDNSTYPALPIAPPGAVCPNVTGNCICWKCGAANTADAGFCIQVPDPEWPSCSTPPPMTTPVIVTVEMKPLVLIKLLLLLLKYCNFFNAIDNSGSYNSHPCSVDYFANSHVF